MIRGWDKLIKEGDSAVKKGKCYAQNSNNSGTDLLDHLKFFYEMDLARKDAMDNVILAYYNKNQSGWWDDAVTKANAFMKFSENPYENDEIEYVKWIIWKNRSDS